MSQEYCNFIVKGDSAFIHEFEKMLEENKIAHSKPQREKPVIETQERVEMEKEAETKMVFREYLYFLTSKETIDFVIAVTPFVLGKIYRWYVSRKKKGEKGEILIRTKKGTTVEVSAESIKKFVFTEGETRKSKKRKKASGAKNKKVRSAR